MVKLVAVRHLALMMVVLVMMMVRPALAEMPYDADCFDRIRGLLEEAAELLESVNLAKDHAASWVTAAAVTAAA